MNTKRIIYKKDDGNIMLLFPNPSSDILAIAKKDVPTGTKFKIVEAKDLPDTYWLGAWEYDFESDSDGVGE